MTLRQFVIVCILSILLQLSETCSEEVRRVMHERSAYVDLHPEIEAACMPDLAALCSQKTQPGEELMCLQEHFERSLSYDE